MLSPDRYEFSVAWGKSISNISSAALALGGYKIHSVYSYLSYKAHLLSISDTNGKIFFSPVGYANTTTFAFIQFEILIMQQCGVGKIYLFTPSK